MELSTEPPEAPVVLGFISIGAILLLYFFIKSPTTDKNIIKHLIIITLLVAIIWYTNNFLMP